MGLVTLKVVRARPRHLSEDSRTAGAPSHPGVLAAVRGALSPDPSRRRTCAQPPSRGVTLGEFIRVGACLCFTARAAHGRERSPAPAQRVGAATRQRGQRVASIWWLRE